MAYAHMAEDVIREVAEQPHGIDGIAEFPPEDFQLSRRGGHRREKVVIALVSAAARAGEDSTAIIKTSSREIIQALAVGVEARLLNGSAGCVKAKHVGARDQFVQLAIFNQSAIIHTVQF